ncbi:hypothetical protein, partial [Yoonia sp.]|uniref:hypothetical protein n=1 Tax=Yoonia sp. TaxID=2212373 RepID=UPI002E002EB0|nr:hypothetical protein [Yoonia sp.]
LDNKRIAAEAERDAALGHIANISSAASQAINEWRDPYEPVAQWEKGVSNAMRGLGEACAAARKKGGDA